MEKRQLSFDEEKLANILRNEILIDSQDLSKKSEEETNIANFEYISTRKEEKEYISPIMTMSEDEILDFVERTDVSELARLSTAELNRIGEVFGLEPTYVVKT